MSTRRIKEHARKEDPTHEIIGIKTFGVNASGRKPVFASSIVWSAGISVACHVNIYLPVTSTFRRGVLIRRGQVQWIESSFHSIIRICEGLSAI